MYKQEETRQAKAQRVILCILYFKLIPDESGMVTVFISIIYGLK